MKRGRPNIRSQIQPIILEILSKTKYPLNISTITKLVSEEMKKPVNWNTVKKYIDELVKIEKVKAISLPHSKNPEKTGLIVYTLKQ